MHFENRLHAGRGPLLAWLLIGLLACASLGNPSVMRTQEARVLETARQMQGSGLTGRLVPQLNGRPRLQKPPLAYWLADAAYAVFGVGVAAGRLPFAMAMWLTAGLTYRIGSHHFGRRAGLVAMGGVLGCVIGARYGLLAETDALSMLFVTAATYAYWRGVDAMPSFGRCARWFHLAAVATALAILSKGPPAAFPFLFFAGYVCLTRRWRALWWWLKCGAPITLIALAVPWFVYIAVAVKDDTIVRELKVVTLGGGHRGPFVNYFAYLAIDLLPWTAMAAMAACFAAKRFRRDPRLGALVLWTLAILVPLCIAGQKQRHYLMPILPPLMLLTGWYIDRAMRSRDTSIHRKFIDAMMAVTSIALIVAGVAVPVVGHMIRGRVMLTDGAATVALTLVAVSLHTARRRGGPATAVMTLAVAASPLVIFLQQGWAPTLKNVTPKAIAKDLDTAFKDRPRSLIGNESLPIQFHLRCPPASLRTQGDIEAAVRRDEQTIFIEVIRGNQTSQDGPLLKRSRAYQWDKNEVRIYEVAR